MIEFVVVKLEEKIELVKERAVAMPEPVVKAMFTPDGRYLAVALLDQSIRLLFTDTFKLFLSLHGHKLPITDFDIASDSTILASTSVDKDIKVWALDYGNFFVRPIFAHQEAGSVTRFVKDTHYLLSGGRDGRVRFWDVDLRQLIFEFEEFDGPVLSIAVSPCGGYFFVGAADLGLRLFRQTKNQTVFQEQ